jgi:rubrerythrin
MSDPKSENRVSSGASADPSLSEILTRHAEMEAQCGEIYVRFAAAFSDKPELRRMWTLMALEEGGHAAMVHAVKRGLLSGALKAKSLLLPFEYLDSISEQLKDCQRRAEEGVSLDQALRITWELECSEMEFMRELLVSSSTLGELGFPTYDENKDQHVGRLRREIQQWTTDEDLRREVKFLSSEMVRPFPSGEEGQ